jgi:hypothetical protein
VVAVAPGGGGRGHRGTAGRTFAIIPDDRTNR